MSDPQMTPAQWAFTRPLSQVLQELLDQMDREGLRDLMTNTEIAEWMIQEVTARGIQVIG